MKHPGYCNISWRHDEWYFRQIAKFIGKLQGDCIDIGKINPKVEYLKYYNPGTKIEQIITEDLNFDMLTGHYDNILLFEVLEHLQNPLWCMYQLKQILKPQGSIWILMYARPRFMWNPEHYFEIPKKHLQKWILEPLDLQIERHKKVYPSHSLFYYFTGFKHFMRLFFNGMDIYQIKIKNNGTYKVKG